MGMVATTLSFSADTSLISSTSQTEPSRVLFIIFTISSPENSIKLHPLSSCLPAFIINHMNQRSRGQIVRASQTSFSSSPPRPKKELKSVVPVGRGCAQPAPRSLLIWGGGLAAKQSDV